MIAIGTDHGGYKLKEEIKKYLEEKGIEYKDFGTYDGERTDFPIYAEKVCKSIQNKECDKGILLCTTGSGMQIVANKFKGIRCVACSNEEYAKQAKEHLNANVLALPAGYINVSEAVAMIRVWLGSEYLQGRYNERLNLIEEIEKENMK